jgi:hypothetical protein
MRPEERKRNAQPIFARPGLRFLLLRADRTMNQSSPITAATMTPMIRRKRACSDICVVPARGQNMVGTILRTSMTARVLRRARAERLGCRLTVHISARGHALYASRRAACVCWATRLGVLRISTMWGPILLVRHHSSTSAK